MFFFHTFHNFHVFMIFTIFMRNLVSRSPRGPKAAQLPRNFQGLPRTSKGGTSRYTFNFRGTSEDFQGPPRGDLGDLGGPSDPNFMTFWQFPTSGPKFHEKKLKKLEKSQILPKHKITDLGRRNRDLGLRRRNRDLTSGNRSL